MKPGVSTSTTSGMPKRLQELTKSAAFSAAALSMTPPKRRGWLATKATGRPSIRARAVTMFRAQSGESSSRLSSSAIAAATSRTS